MSETLEAIEKRHGVGGWTNARPSELRVHGWLQVKFELEHDTPVLINAGNATNLARDLRSAGSAERADVIDCAVAELVKSRAYPEMLRIINPRRK